MNDAVPLLNGIASRQQVLGVVVFNLLERAVFALLGGPVSHDGHRHLNVCVAHLGVSEDEVTFQLSNGSTFARPAVIFGTSGRSGCTC